MDINITKGTNYEDFIRGKINIYVKLYILIFILNRFFKLLFEGCQRWTTSYVSREGVEKLWILIKKKTVEYLFNIREDERSLRALCCGPGFVTVLYYSFFWRIFSLYRFYYLLFVGLLLTITSETKLCFDV